MADIEDLAQEFQLGHVDVSNSQIPSDVPLQAPSTFRPTFLSAFLGNLGPALGIGMAHSLSMDANAGGLVGALAQQGTAPQAPGASQGSPPTPTAPIAPQLQPGGFFRRLAGTFSGKDAIAMQQFELQRQQFEGQLQQQQAARGEQVFPEQLRQQQIQTQVADINRQILENRMQLFSDPGRFDAVVQNAVGQFGQLQPDEQARLDTSKLEARFKGDPSPVMQAVQQIATQRAITGRVGLASPFLQTYRQQLANQNLDEQSASPQQKLDAMVHAITLSGGIPAILRGAAFTAGRITPVTQIDPRTGQLQQTFATGGQLGAVDAIKQLADSAGIPFGDLHKRLLTQPQSGQPGVVSPEPGQSAPMQAPTQVGPQAAARKADGAPRFMPAGTTVTGAARNQAVINDLVQAFQNEEPLLGALDGPDRAKIIASVADARKSLGLAGKVPLTELGWNTVLRNAGQRAVSPQAMQLIAMQPRLSAAILGIRGSLGQAGTGSDIQRLADMSLIPDLEVDTATVARTKLQNAYQLIDRTREGMVRVIPDLPTPSQLKKQQGKRNPFR